MLCRFNQTDDLVPVIDLGVQSFTGIFLLVFQMTIPTGSLRVGLSTSSGLLQLMDSFSPAKCTVSLAIGLD